jgi:succinoglycan biosynthesis transport protein ExoP
MAVSTMHQEMPGASRDPEVEKLSPGASRVPFLPDPGLMWQVFRRNLKLFLAIVVLVLGLTAGWALTRTPLYEASSSVLIKPSASPVRTTTVDEPQAAAANAEIIDTQIRLIGSEYIAARAATAYARQSPPPDGGTWTEEKRADLASRMLNLMTVTRDGTTLVIDITAQGEDPEFVAATANLFAEQYIQAQVDAKTNSSSETGRFLQTRLAELQRDALAAQAAVDQYRVRNNLVSANGGTMAEQEVSQLNQQLAIAQADLAEKRGRLAAAQQQLTRGGGGADVGAALGSGTIGGLRSQEATTAAELAAVTARYGPLHPQRRQLENRLLEIRSSIQQEIDRVLSSLRAEVATAQSRVVSLSGSRGGAAGALAANGRAQAGLNALLVRAKAAETIYENFLARMREVGALQGAEQPDATIAVRAEVPELPVSPNLRLLALAGIVGALALGLAGIGAAEYLRRGVQTKRDVERRLRLRYAGAVPTLKSALGKARTRDEPHDYIVNYPHSLFAEAFRSIRTFLTLSAGSRARVIAITSALPREGKTTTAVCLARATAMEGARTLLVDADLRRRGASELLRYPDQPDLYRYLAGDTPLEQAVFVDDASGLHVLGTVEPPTNALNPLVEARVSAMFAELREHYDVIIVDTAPVLGVAETRVVAMLADRVLLLTRWKHTSLRAIEAMADMLVDGGAKITGLALTQVDINRYASTGDGDVYGYAKKFRGYYTN